MGRISGVGGDDRWHRVLSAFATAGRPGSRTLCSVACDVLEVSTVSVLLMSNSHRGRLCASDPTAAGLDDLQYTTGEGPSVDACRSSQLVAEQDVRTAGSRWPAFASAAAEAGVAAVFAHPLRVGAARLGALTVYQAAAGPLSDEQRASVAVVADVVTLRVIAIQAADGRGSELAGDLEEAAIQRAEVHQASGMVAAQLGVGIVEALVRLRSHAYMTGEPLAEVAANVVSRRLRFE